MKPEEAWTSVKTIFQDVFTAAPPPAPNTRQGDVPDWDSLGHIRLLMTVERRLGIKFAAAEMARFACLGDIASAVAEKKQ